MFDLLQGKKTYIAGIITAAFAVADAAGYGIPSFVYAICAVAFGTAMKAGQERNAKARDRK